MREIIPRPLETIRWRDTDRQGGSAAGHEAAERRAAGIRAGRRCMGNFTPRVPSEDPHSAVQVRLVEIFYELRKKHRVYCRTELRVRLAPARIRIPDLAVFQPGFPL